MYYIIYLFVLFAKLILFVHYNPSLHKSYDIYEKKILILFLMNRKISI